MNCNLSRNPEIAFSILLRRFYILISPVISTCVVVFPNVSSYRFAELRGMAEWHSDVEYLFVYPIFIYLVHLATIGGWTIRKHLHEISLP